MIHFRSEATPLKSGLNITVGKCWVTFTYLSVSLQNYRADAYRLRLRLYPCYPKVFYSKDSWNIIINFCDDRDYTLIDKETKDDIWGKFGWKVKSVYVESYWS